MEQPINKITELIAQFETAYNTTTEIIQLHGKTLSLKIFKDGVMIMYARREGSGFKTFPGHETGSMVEDFELLCRRVFTTNLLAA